MATITDLVAGDNGSVSLGVINTNFDNLNADKIESDSADTLENKVIDADDNTISNIETDNLKSSAKTGLDTKVVTGTAGSTDELGKFNSDGDLVSAGVSVSTTQPNADSLDTELPTSRAVYNAINNMNGGSKEMFFYPTVNSAGATANPFTQTVGGFYTAQVTNAQGVFFNFRTPTDFNTIVSAVVVMIPDATETIQWDVATDYGASGEAYNTHSGSIADRTASATTSQIIEADVAPALASLSAGDYVGLDFQSDTSNLRIIGMYFKYA